MPMKNRAFLVFLALSVFTLSGCAALQSLFVVRSALAEYVVSIPEGGVTANFAGQAAWSELKYSTP